MPATPKPSRIPRMTRKLREALPEAMGDDAACFSREEYAACVLLREGMSAADVVLVTSMDRPRFDAFYASLLAKLKLIRDHRSRVKHRGGRRANKPALPEGVAGRIGPEGVSP